MTIWNGEPYPGFFNDNVGSGFFLTQLNEAFMPDTKWILNREDEGDNNPPISEFAEFNAAVLGIIHNEKRFPTKDELAELSFMMNPLRQGLSNLLGTLDWADSYQTIWADTKPIFTPFINDKDTGISSSSCDTINFVIGGTTDFTVNGLSDVDLKPLPESALLSTKGCNKYNTGKKFLNEIKNYE